MNPHDIGWTEAHQQASEPDFYGKWVSVNHSMPQKDGRYLIHKHSGHIVTTMYYTHHDNLFFGGVIATHWMPLPNPPELLEQ